jgi:hypothetical protein
MEWLIRSVEQLSRIGPEQRNQYRGDWHRSINPHLDVSRYVTVTIVLWFIISFGILSLVSHGIESSRD